MLDACLSAGATGEVAASCMPKLASLVRIQPPDCAGDLDISLGGDYTRLTSWSCLAWVRREMLLFMASERFLRAENV